MSNLPYAFDNYSYRNRVNDNITARTRTVQRTVYGYPALHAEQAGGAQHSQAHSFPRTNVPGKAGSRQKRMKARLVSGGSWLISCVYGLEPTATQNFTPQKHTEI